MVAKYPTNVCPRYIIRLALYLQDTKNFVRPTSSPFISDLLLSDGGVELAQEEDDFEYVKFDEKSTSSQIPPKNSRKSGNKVATAEDKNADLLLWHRHLECIQSTLTQMEEAIKISDCDHQLVHLSFKQAEYIELSWENI